MSPEGFADGNRAGWARNALVPGFVLLMAGLAVYHGVIDYGFVNWDDHKYIHQNPYLSDEATVDPGTFFLTPNLGYPVPVTAAAYWAVKQAFGFDPAWYHGLNLFLHLLNSLLVFVFLRGILGRHRALAGALLWSLHPLAAEPVAWCTGTKDLLNGSFSVGALVLLSLSIEPPGRKRDRTSLYLALALLAGVLAIFSKPTALVLPALFILFLFYRQRLFLLRTSSHIRVIVLLAVCALFVVVAGVILSQNDRGIDGYSTLADRALFSRDHFGAISQSLYLQLKHFFYPVGLVPQYPRLTGMEVGHPVFIAGTALVLLIAVLLVVFYRNRRWESLFFLGFFVIAYLPTSQVVPFNRFIADSYLYLPSIGLVGLVLSWIPLPGKDLRSVGLFWALSLPFILCCAVLTGHQHPIWQSGRTLWSAGLDAYPGLAIMSSRYANACYLEDDLPETLRVLTTEMDAIKEEGIVDPFILAMYSRHRPQEEARALYLWTYANQISGFRDRVIDRNYLTFLLDNRIAVTAIERPYVKNALSGGMDEMRMAGEENHQPYLVLGVFAAENGFMVEAGRLLDEAYRLSDRPELGQAAARAFRTAGLHEEAARVEGSLAR